VTTVARVADEGQELAQAARQIAAAEERIVHQERIIERLAAAGRETVEAERLLELLRPTSRNRYPGTERISRREAQGCAPGWKRWRTWRNVYSTKSATSPATMMATAAWLKKATATTPAPSGAPTMQNRQST
jgi:hypothetical protein